MLILYVYDWIQIEALKAIGVTEVVLAINYQPEVKSLNLCAHFHLQISNKLQHDFVYAGDAQLPERF